MSIYVPRNKIEDAPCFKKIILLNWLKQ